MTEYAISKDRYMQVYNYPDHCTVSFYNGSRMDMETVEYFSAHATLFSCATFYTGVPYAAVEQYLETVAIKGES
jgi:hypothetical protein